MASPIPHTLSSSNTPWLPDETNNDEKRSRQDRQVSGNKINAYRRLCYTFDSFKIPQRPFTSKYSRAPGLGLFTNPETRIRRFLILLSTLLAILSLVFTILVLLGNTFNSPVLNNIYFLKLDLSNLIPESVPDHGLINSIAQSLGLRDFYQVGIWGYCEGYNRAGVTYCSPPKHLYWFNPVDILTGQLFRGAKIALPANITEPLELAKTSSYWMFVCFMVGIAFTFLSICIGWIAIYSRWASGICSCVQGIAMAGTTIAAVMASTIYSLFRSTFEVAPEVTVKGILGEEMFVYMWMAAGFSIASFILHTLLCCFTRSEKTFRKKIAKVAIVKREAEQQTRVESVREKSSEAGRQSVLEGNTFVGSSNGSDRAGMV
ncbi:SUR7/PalI family-domain-containing protein [Kalaharituber pfeilii]|nr:SUR7/PalI family-domain-containing protein [Kalaharituber pfeilii]